MSEETKRLLIIERMMEEIIEKEKYHDIVQADLAESLMALRYALEFIDLIEE